MSKIFLGLLLFFSCIQPTGWSQSLNEKFVQKAINLSAEDSKKIERQVIFGHPFKARAIIFDILNKDPKLTKKKIHVKSHTLDKSIHQIGGMKALAKKYLLWINSPFNSLPEEINKKMEDDLLYEDARQDSLHKEKTLRDSLYRALYDLKKWGNLRAYNPELTYNGFVPQNNELLVDTSLPILLLYTQDQPFKEKRILVVTTYSFMSIMLKVLEENRTAPQFQPLYEMVQTILENPVQEETAGA